ncbi:MAG TPA: DUF3500 domain-containing protein [Gemmata sp.]|jgi:hypothetical protein|nr:DUF3500 domain-containing protein [Gemmata sp.]
MKRVRIAAIVATVLIFTAVALIGQSEPKSTGGKMQIAAEKFLGSLSQELKTKASFTFNDKHRLAWFFTPQQDKEKKFTRKGARVEEMTGEQKVNAMALLKSGLSAQGYEQATTIVGMESLLADLEGTKGAMTRNPGWYFVSVFGDPSGTGKWGWRFEGHHLSVNYTLDKGEVISATPLLFGANPAIVKGEERKGLRTLPDIENHARALIKSLTPEQDKVAKQPTPKNYTELEIKEGQPNAAVGNPVGITADKLTEEQKETLNKLLLAYIDRMPADLAQAELKRVKDTPSAKLYFEYTGSPVPGEPYTYRVFAPEFVVEFLNVQADSAKNPANHIHSAWRRLPIDFGVSE